MPKLQEMPRISIPQEKLAEWGNVWLDSQGTAKADGTPIGDNPSRFNRKQVIEFGRIFDDAFAAALAKMLGGIPVVTPKASALPPPESDCVEVGTIRVIGGIRPQNYDAAYRPDGPRVVFDSKTQNNDEGNDAERESSVNGSGL